MDEQNQHDESVDETTETQDGAGDESVAKTGGQGQQVDLTEFDEFRKYQSSMESKLQKALNRNQELESAVGTLQEQFEAQKAGREYDQDALQEIHDMMTRQRETRQHVRALRDTWGHLGLNEDDNPKVVARLADVESKEEADQLVYDWIQQTVGKAKGGDEVDEQKQALNESGVDESPIPAATGGVDPDSLEETTRRMREEVKETGKSRLGDWLQATEPHFPTRANQREGRKSSLS